MEPAASAPRGGFDLKRQKLLFWILTAVYILCVVLSWLLPELGVHASVLPLNTLPLLIVVGGAVSGSAFVGCVVSMVVLYGLLLFGLLGARSGKRAGCICLLILMTLDIAANVVFSVTSWWYLAAIFLDLIIMGLILRFSFGTK